MTLPFTTTALPASFGESEHPVRTATAITVVAIKRRFTDVPFKN
jgi:hypothetical protein